MLDRTFTITDQPQLVSSWVPPYVLVLNKGAAPIYLGDRNVSPTSYDVVVEPTPAGMQSSPVDIKEVAIGNADLYAVAAAGSVELQVVNYGGGGQIRLDALRALVSTNAGGVPVELLAGDTLDELIASASRANAWIRTIITADITELAS